MVTHRTDPGVFAQTPISSLPQNAASDASTPSIYQRRGSQSAAANGDPPSTARAEACSAVIAGRSAGSTCRQRNCTDIVTHHANQHRSRQNSRLLRTSGH